MADSRNGEMMGLNLKKAMSTASKPDKNGPPIGIPGPGHSMQLEGSRPCPFCEKDLMASEMSIRPHLRVHTREGRLAKADELETFKDILFRRTGDNRLGHKFTDEEVGDAS